MNPTETTDPDLPDERAAAKREGDEVRKKWGQAIREQRTYLGLTQKQLAEAVGVTQITVSSWETGHTSPTPDRQLAIGRALNINPRVLFAYPDAA